MSTWLYQLNQKDWPPDRYRVEIWEGERWSWPARKGISKTDPPKPGDTIVFFYTPTSGKDPGFYGWAIILEWFAEEPTLYFRAVAPSDILKMHPWWDSEARAVVDEIRGPMAQKTLFKVPQKIEARLRQGLTAWAAASK